MKNTINKNKIVSIIPARGGSKRLIKKNIFPIWGKPMICHTLNAARNSYYLDNDNIFVSTEDNEIKKIVNNYGASIVNRPIELAQDDIWTQDVVNHFSDQLDLSKNDIIVILQANSPQISPKIIDQCIEMLINHDLWQVHTVGKDFINNGAIQIMRNFVKDQKGKVNYNGVVVTDWIDVHTIKDIRKLEKIKINGS